MLGAPEDTDRYVDVLKKLFYIEGHTCVHEEILQGMRVICASVVSHVVVEFGALIAVGKSFGSPHPLAIRSASSLWSI